MKRITIAALAVATVVAGCGSQADTASKNISTQAEQFKVIRRIVGVNGITDKVEFEITGRCSYEHVPGELVVTCKERDATKTQQALYSKSTVGLSDNMFFISTQLEGVNVSEFHTKVILKPQGLVPDLDLVTG